MSKLYLLLLCCVVGTFAHNWLTYPHSRNGNVAATNKPCENMTAGAPTIIYAGTQLRANWTTNHNGTIHELYVIPLANQSALEMQKNTSVYFVGAYPNAVGTGFYTIPNVGGRFVLQYRWGTYRNCADLEIQFVAPAGSTPTNSSDIYRLPNNHGSFNATSDEITCDPGYEYVQSDSNYCVALPSTTGSTGTSDASSGTTGSTTDAQEGSDASVTSVAFVAVASAIVALFV